MPINVYLVLTNILTLWFLFTLIITLVRVYREEMAITSGRLLKEKVNPSHGVYYKMNNELGDRMRALAYADAVEVRIDRMINEELLQFKRIRDEIDKLVSHSRLMRVLEIAHRIARLKHYITSHLMELSRKTNNFNLLKFIELTPLRRLIKYKKIEEEITSWNKQY